MNNIFDLDGTLVQTEKLKASSCAVGVQRLLGLPQPDQRVVEAYRDMASHYTMKRLAETIQAVLKSIIVPRMEVKA